VDLTLARVFFYFTLPDNKDKIAVMPRSNELVEIDGEVRARTDRAVQFYDGDVVVWLPLSQVELSDDETSVLVPRWLAEEKGLI
jgi:hypothetical protein